MMTQLSILRTNFTGSRVPKYEADFIGKRRVEMDRQRQEELERRESKTVTFIG